MAVTYVPLATSNFSGTSTVTFNSISQSYTDLKLLISNVKPSTTSTNFIIRMNNASTSNYAYAASIQQFDC